jgi:hypothetical protein
MFAMALPVSESRDSTGFTGRSPGYNEREVELIPRP